jgi:hypothetical protein
MTIAPDVSRRGRRGRRLAIGCLIIAAVLIGLPLIFTVLLDYGGSRGPELQTVAFGTGGSECDLDRVGSTFPVGASIRDVLTLEPALEEGDDVTITVERDGTELVELQDTVTIEEPAPCIYGSMPPLQAGHYRVIYEVSRSKIPPISGEFDVSAQP